MLDMLKAEKKKIGSLVGKEGRKIIKLITKIFTSQYIGRRMVDGSQNFIHGVWHGSS